MKNTNYYKDLLGLSCIENSVLMYLQNGGQDISWLYADSEIGLEDLFKYFFIYKKDYEHFDGFPRIENKLKKLGILSMSIEDRLEVLLEDLKNNFLYLIKVKPKKIIC